MSLEGLAAVAVDIVDDASTVSEEGERLWSAEDSSDESTFLKPTSLWVELAILIRFRSRRSLAFCTWRLISDSFISSNLLLDSDLDVESLFTKRNVRFCLIAGWSWKATILNRRLYVDCQLHAERRIKSVCATIGKTPWGWSTRRQLIFGTDKSRCWST